MHNVPWSEKECEILSKMILGGAGSAEIAKVLKSRSAPAIRRKATDLNLPIRPAAEIDMEEFKRIMKGRKV